MQTRTSEKHDPVSRSRWALAFEGIPSSARLVLVALADFADQKSLVSWPSVETLASKTQVSVRGVQYALRQLESAKAISTARSLGRTSSRYRLLIQLNPAISAGFNPAIPAPNPAESAPFNPAEIAPQPSYSSEQANKNQPQQHLRGRDAKQPAAAAANHSVTVNGTDPEKRLTCPQCANTWPERFGTVCYPCQFNLATLNSDANCITPPSKPAQ